MLRSLIAAAALLLTVTASHAQQQCGPMGRVFELLKEKHNEKMAWYGQIGNGMAVGMLLQSEAGTWTFLIIRGEVACIAASGDEGTKVVTGLPI